MSRNTSNEATLVKIDTCIYCDKKAEYLFYKVDFWGKRIYLVCPEHKKELAIKYMTNR